MNDKKEIVVEYDSLLQTNSKDAIEKIKSILDANENEKIVIDFKRKNFEKNELEEIFDFLIKYKKDKIIFLRNITDRNYSLIKYWQNRNAIENKLNK